MFRARLFRESCVYYRGNYIKDLNRLGRDLQKIVIVDNSPASYIFHPDNAVSRQQFEKVAKLSRRAHRKLIFRALLPLFAYRKL